MDAISYGRDQIQPVYVGEAGDLFRRVREHWDWLRWRRGLAMDGLRYRALPLASRDEARAVERALIARWHPAWDAHRGGTKSAWFEATHPKVAWAWRWPKNRGPAH